LYIVHIVTELIQLQIYKLKTCR